MGQLDRFKKAADDFKKQEFALKKQAQEYEALQREIAALRERAPFDADARRKLERLDEYMSTSGRQLQERMQKKTTQLGSVLNGLAEQLADLLPKGGRRDAESEGAQKPAVANKAARTFV
jgi:hypothetical protein